MEGWNNLNFDFKNAQKGQLSLVATNGKLNFPAQTCKDYAKEAISYSVNRDWSATKGVYDAGVKGQINLGNPMFVVWTSPDTVERNALKFTQLINQIETIMGLSLTVAYPVNTGIGNNAAPYVAEADSWWIKSPIAADAYMLLMRLSIAMRLNEPLEAFVERICALQKHDKYSITRDAGYFRLAKSKGNLTGLLEKSLPCFNREGYSDWLLSFHERGFSHYNTERDATIAMDEKSLVKKWAK
jgi:hypothetical protein